MFSEKREKKQTMPSWNNTVADEDTDVSFLDHSLELALGETQLTMLCREAKLSCVSGKAKEPNIKRMCAVGWRNDEIRKSNLFTCQINYFNHLITRLGRYNRPRCCWLHRERLTKNAS